MAGLFLKNEYLLMNKDVPVLRFVCIDEGISRVFKEIEWVHPELKPIGYADLNEWLESRQVAKHRQSIAALLKEIGCFNLEGFVKTTHGLSLNDTFWVMEADKPLHWRDVSLYSNPFDEVISKIALEGGLYGRQFGTTGLSPEFGVSGNYRKCWVLEDGNIYLLKGGTSGFSNAGLEPFCEGLAAQVSKLICPSAVDYEIARFHGSDVCKCKLFTDERFGYVPVSSVFRQTVSDNDVFEFFKKQGCEDGFRRMVVLDALILNQDRHRGNYGFLFNNDTLQIHSMAPVFDHNLSLLVYATEEHLLGLDAYLQGIGPKIGDDFIGMAHKLLTLEIRSDLKGLRGFEFDFSRCPNFSPLRQRTLNEVVNRQIDRVLDGERIIVPQSVQKDGPIYCDYVEGEEEKGLMVDATLSAAMNASGEKRGHQERGSEIELS